jgi:hypothetical protein
MRMGTPGSDVKLPRSWLLLVYRVPSEPSNNRVSIWRDMKRIGALYLQNCVCLLPALPGMRARLNAVVEKIEHVGGSSNLFEIRRIEERQLAEVVDSFRALSDREYGEIVEECITKFQKEIEFERFRRNYTFEEAEEIYADLLKLKDWLDRVRARDWFACPRRSEAEARVAESERLFEAFERDCYAANEGSELGRGAGGDELIRTAATRSVPARRRRPRVIDGGR